MAAPEPHQPAASFRWQDGERLIVFGEGAAGQAAELAGEGFVLLTTRRAQDAVPGLAERAAAVHHVGPGRVDELAGELRPRLGQPSGELLLALGGGRVIDVAKALAAADPPRRAAAIPTTLSAAEMTPIHRHAAGVPMETPRVRPVLVINDPALCASQPAPELAASAANALAHAAEALVSTLTNPASTLAALETARLIAAGLAGEAPRRPELALAALLSGWANGYTLYGLHHVFSQTLARFAGVGHGPANAAMLPHTLRALTARSPERLSVLERALGDEPASFAAGLARQAGAVRLRDHGVTAEQIAECTDQALQRSELALTPPPAEREEIQALYEAAW